MPALEEGEPSDFWSFVDYTDETAERNPDWRLDVCEEVIGSWRGQYGQTASMTLVWGRPLVSGGRIVTAELADLAVDQCESIDDRFTLVAPDDYRGDLLEIKLFDLKGRGSARESLTRGGGGRGRGARRGRGGPAPTIAFLEFFFGTSTFAGLDGSSVASRAAGGLRALVSTACQLLLLRG